MTFTPTPTAWEWPRAVATATAQPHSVCSLYPYSPWTSARDGTWTLACAAGDRPNVYPERRERERER